MPDSTSLTMMTTNPLNDMKTNGLHICKSLLNKLALAALLLVGSSSAAVADELTVNGGASNTNKYLPIYVEGAATFNAKGEYIIPSDLLESVSNKKITKLSYDVYTKATATGNATYSVYLDEVSSNVYPQSGYDYLKSNSAILVYSGALDATGETMDIEFTSEFVYSGTQNLLVHIECTSTGSEGYPYFRGKSDWSNYRGLYTSSATANTRSAFVPKTTITYEEATSQTSPKLTVSPSTVAFGNQRANETRTVTVSNTGVGTMDVTIANDNTTDFTISETSLTSIGAGESKTFTVTFNYNAESLGAKTANITITPNYDAEAAATVAVSAYAANAGVWEDFDSGIPSTWYNQNGSWLNNVKVYNGPDLAGMASPGTKSSDVLRTPRLYAEANEVISFDVLIGGATSSYKIKAEYSTNRTSWTNIATYTESGSQSFTAPATGNYWLRFTGYQSGIDNFSGWRIADATHEAKLGTASIPTTGTAYGTYTASVNVMELGGSNETITAELYFDDVKVAEQTGIALSANYDQTVSVSYEPTTEGTYNVYLKVYGDNIEPLITNSKNVTIAETTYVLDENSEDHPTCSNAVVKVKYTAQQGWNTIVMPFSLTDSPAYMKSLFGEDWTAYAINKFEDGKLTFKKSATMAQSTPYLVYAPNATANAEGVYLKNVSIFGFQWTSNNTTQTKGDATFKGTYAPIAAPGMEGKYGITKKGTLAKGGSGASIRAYRAYIEIAEDAPQEIRLYVIDDDTTTQIGSLVQMMEGKDKAVYNLSGQRVQTATKGLYIVDGKKIVVK